MKKRIKAWQIVVAVPVILFSIIMIASGFSLISDGETGSGVQFNGNTGERLSEAGGGKPEDNGLDLVDAILREPDGVF